MKKLLASALVMGAVSFLPSAGASAAGVNITDNYNRSNNLAHNISSDVTHTSEAYSNTSVKYTALYYVNYEYNQTTFSRQTDASRYNNDFMKNSRLSNFSRFSSHGMNMPY
jgi:hypothetical protein